MDKADEINVDHYAYPDEIFESHCSNCGENLGGEGYCWECNELSGVETEMSFK